jgi:hypothetical protein
MTRESSHINELLLLKDRMISQREAAYTAATIQWQETQKQYEHDQQLKETAYQSEMIAVKEQCLLWSNKFQEAMKLVQELQSNNNHNQQQSSNNNNNNNPDKNKNKKVSIESISHQLMQSSSSTSSVEVEGVSEVVGDITAGDKTTATADGNNNNNAANFIVEE